MRYAIGASKGVRYQQNDCSDRVGATCNRVTVLAGHSHPYRDQEIPLLLFSCLLKLLYKRAPRIISKSQRFCRHEKAAKEAAEKENTISTIGKIS
jgi:hypothetical protein